ncbi:hypothetical protein ACFL1X_07895 [Candidatus Hydrogenedentota bacterium]
MLRVKLVMISFSFVAILWLGSGVAHALELGWSDPLLINSPGNDDSRDDSAPDLVIDGDGTLHAVWQSREGYGGAGRNLNIFYARNDGTGWTFPELVNNDGDTTTKGNTSAHIAVGNDGVLHVIWAMRDYSDPDSNDYDICYASNSGSSWSDPEVVNPWGDSDEPQQHDTAPQIQVTPDNVVHIVWACDWKTDAGEDYPVFYMHSVEEGWSEPQAIDGNTGIARGPRMAIDSKGDIHVVWDAYKGSEGYGDDMDVFYASNSGGSWSEPVLVNTFGIDDSERDKSPAIHVDMNDSAHVVWISEHDLSGTGINGSRYYYSVNAGAGWSDATTVSDDGIHHSAPASIVSDQSGGLHALWRRDYDIVFSARDDSGWSEPAIVYDPRGGEAYVSQITYAKNALYAVWYSNSARSDRDCYMATYYLDHDEDGMADAWEDEHGLDSSIDDSGEDSDEDVFTNIQEFITGSDPSDETDLANEVFVDPENGIDHFNEGREDSPWKTINFAEEAVVGSEELPMTIKLLPGVYEEQVKLYEYESIMGADAATTFLQWYQTASNMYVLEMSDYTGVSGITITTPAPEEDTVRLLVADNVEASVSQVILNGKDNPQSYGIIVKGAESSDTTVAHCVFKRLGYGVHAVHSSAEFAENSFEDIHNYAIFTRPPDEKLKDGEDVLVPTFGNAFDSSTGGNIFRNVIGLLVYNSSDVEIKAENNDWGVYTAEEIMAKINGPVDFQPFLGKDGMPDCPLSALAVGSNSATLTGMREHRSTALGRTALGLRTICAYYLACPKDRQ